MTDLLALLMESSTVRTVALGAILIGATAGAAGCLALLKRESLLSDAISHAALPGICLGFIIAGQRNLPMMLAGALLAGGLAALLIALLRRVTILKADAAMGVALSVFFAAGLVLMSMIQARGGGDSGLSTFLFGQAAAMLADDVQFIAIAAGMLALLLALTWKQVKLTLFDRDFAIAAGIPVGLVEAGITLVIAATVVLGLQMTGVVLMVALLVAPAAAARQWTDDFAVMILIAALTGAAAGLAGALLSATAQGVATGPSIVLFATLAALVSLLFAPGRGLLARRFKIRRRAP
jgi:manganese/zinc/iron transport system permease protein